MGKYLEGIPGPFTGLIGTIVGSSWNGIDVMRSRPKKTGRPVTAVQLEQRERFAKMIFYGFAERYYKNRFKAYNIGGPV